MKKILFSVLTVAFLVTGTTASAFALFTTTASVNNVAFSTGNAALLICPTSVYDANTCTPTYDFSPTILAKNVAPGYDSGPQTVYLYNKGTVPLDVSLQLTSYSGNWSSFENVVNLAVKPAFPSQALVSGPLANWNAGSVPIVTDLPGGMATLTVDFSVLSTADNSIANQTFNSDWVITGIQHL